MRSARTPALIALFLCGLLLQCKKSSDEPRISTRPGSFTIFILGGSTSAGAPYHGQVDFGRILAELFEGEIAGRPIEVQNLGKPGMDAGYCLGRAEDVIDSGLDPESCVVLLYTGNNEFLKHDDRNDLSREERRLFDERLISDSERAATLETFADNVEAILERFDEAELPVVLSTVAIHLAEWEPNRSVLEDPRHASELQRLLELGEEGLHNGDAERALTAFEQAVRLEPHFAWALHRLGSALILAGRHREAREALLDGLEHDHNPVSALPRSTNRLLSELAEKYAVPLVDADEILRLAVPSGIPGYDLFWDNAHPTLAGYLEIAKGFATQIEALTGTRASRLDMQSNELAERLALDEASLAAVNNGSGQYCYGLSTLIWNPASRLRQARIYLNRAEELSPEDPNVLCSQGVLRLLEDDVPGSRSYWSRAYDLAPKACRRRLQHPRLRQILARNGLEPEDLFLDPR